MENDFFRKQLIEEYTQQKQFDKAVALCLASEQACGSSRVSSHEWQKRRYDIYDKTGDVDAQRQVAEALLVEGHSEYYGCLHKPYAAGQWPRKREELLERLSGFQPLVYLKIITEEADKPRVIAYLREKPFAVFRLYPHLLPYYAGEVREIFLLALRGCAAHASDRRDYQDVCCKIGAFAKAFGNEAAAELIREMRRQARLPG
ncbi:MAG: hypothetical protein MRZ54_12230 [Clostridiales bacterium]|nr:hypothetical protein [Clostridiales bacterium]